MADSWSRLRLLLTDSFVTIVAVLVVIALLGGWLTYTTHVAQGTHIENRTMAEWESTGDFDHSATVINGSGAFSEGTTLSNRSTYFTAIAPVLDGSFAYSYDAAEGNVTANATLQFVLRSVGEGNGEATEYWRVTRQLGSNRTGSLGPGETLREAFSRNMSAMRQLAERTEERIGGSQGTVETLVVARVDTEGTIEGEGVSRTREYRLPIEMDDGQYRVVDPGPVTNTTTVAQRVSVADTYGALRAAGSVLLLVLSLGLLVGLVGARQQGMLDLDDRERDRLHTDRARAEYEEWITTAHLPDAALDAPLVEVDSLEGLVDVAIDTNDRVINDPDRDGCFVLGDRVSYTYSLPGSRDDSETEREATDGTAPVSDGQSDEAVDQSDRENDQ